MEMLMGVLKEGNIVYIAVALMVTCFFNINSICSFFEERKRIKSNRITETLTCEDLSTFTKKMLNEELIIERFKNTTGLDLNARSREEFSRIYCYSEGEMSISLFRRAKYMIGYSDNKIVVKIGGGLCVSA